MFRHSVKTNQLIALLLPLTFLWSWAACVSLCAEITARQPTGSSASKTIQSKDEICSGETDKADGCPMTANAAVVKERQTVKNFSAISPFGLVLSFYVRSFERSSARLPEINQNSPPEISFPPLFVRLCTFRI